MTAYPLANSAPLDALRFAQPPSDPMLPFQLRKSREEGYSSVSTSAAATLTRPNRRIFPSSHFQHSVVFEISGAWDADVSMKAEMTALNVGIAVVIVLLGPWMLGQLVHYTSSLYTSIPSMVGS